MFKFIKKKVYKPIEMWYNIVYIMNKVDNSVNTMQYGENIKCHLQI